MRKLSLVAVLSFVNAAAAHAQEAPAQAHGLMDIELNLMVWVLVIFLVFVFIFKKFFLGLILGAVEKREKALEDTLAAAKRDRDEAAAILATHAKQLEAAKNDAQTLIADARATAEKVKHDILEQARTEQQAALERAQREIQSERDAAVAQLRREAISLAIAGASRVIEENLDNAKNRALVESFLSSVTLEKAS